MSSSPPSPARRGAIALRDGSSVTLLVLATTVPAAVLSGLTVMSFSAETEWVMGVLGTDIGFLTIFLVVPAVIGIATARAVRRGGTPLPAAAALGSLAPPLILVVLMSLAAVL